MTADYLSNLTGYSDLVSRLIVEELYRQNVSTYAVSPGARLIPLLEAIKLHEKTNIKIFNDERASAFWAQGHAKASGLPVVVLTTSGTAVCNLLPGVTEAYQSNMPLIIITCDRPWELHYAKANQTILQKNIFKDFTKLQIDLPAIEEKIFPESILANIAQLVSCSLSGTPVHLNIAFRKPFAQENFSLEKLPENEASLIQNWFYKKEKFIHYSSKSNLPEQNDLDYLINKIDATNSPLIIAGPLKNKTTLSELSNKLKTPVFADLDSGVRSTQEGICSLYNLYCDQIETEPDLILYFGDRIVSERLKEFLTRQDCLKILISDYALRQDAIENDFLYFERKIIAEPAKIISVLNYKTSSKESSKLFDNCISLEKETQKQLKEEKQWSEVAALRKITALADQNTAIYHSSSLLLRELEYFAEFNGQNVKCNRGTVGIDGVLASALGYAEGSNQKTFLLIGDQALLYDLNSLALLQNSKLHVFLINNSGGAIFNLLPHKNINNILFNEHQTKFADICKGFNINYKKISSFKDLKPQIEAIGSCNNPTFTELQFDNKISSVTFLNYL